MKFSELAEYLEKLEKISSRIEITKILASIFKKAKAEETDKITYLLLGRLASSYENIVFNIAERMMLTAVATAYDKDLKEIKALYREKGDMGDVVESIAKGKGKNLTVSQVYDRARKIAQDEGEGSQDRKIKEMAALLKDLDPLSAKFVARIPIGKLRLGFSDKTILDALSWAENGDKSLKSNLEKAYRTTPDVGALAKKVKTGGVIKASKDTSITLGIPILPMLAQRIKSPAEMIEKMGEVAIEPKLDGLRTQIHIKKGKDGFVKAFTRNLNEISSMFPELKNAPKFVRAREVILDTEAVGLDKKGKMLVNFQTTMTRRRKHSVKETARKVPIKFYVFDCLFKNGKSLMNSPYLERRKYLDEVLKEGALFERTRYILTKDPKEITKQNEEKRKEGLEGIMIKKADSTYVPGRTGWRWVKMKEAEKAIGRLADTVDCIVMGYSAGKGKRAQFGLGQFLVGVRDGKKIKTITKIGTGITDEQFKEFKKRLTKLEVEEMPKSYVVNKNLKPDYWIKPEIVVEVAADDITKSPTHSAEYALRFPRLVRFRDDKGVKQATTVAEVKRLFEMQNS